METPECLNFQKTDIHIEMFQSASVKWEVQTRDLLQNAMFREHCLITVRMGNIKNQLDQIRFKYWLITLLLLYML